jgi:hypothetical protein
MKPDVSVQSAGKRAYRRKANGTCGICHVCPVAKGQRRCRICRRLTVAFSTNRAKTDGRTLDDDVKMVELALKILQRRFLSEMIQVRPGIFIPAWEVAA